MYSRFDHALTAVIRDDDWALVARNHIERQLEVPIPVVLAFGSDDFIKARCAKQFQRGRPQHRHEQT